MNKLTEDFQVNPVALSLSVLKTVDVGDMVLVLAEDCARAMEVTERTSSRGRNGFTALKLKDLYTDAVLDLPTTNEIPKGIISFNKVLQGINERTKRKIVPPMEAIRESIDNDAPPSETEALIEALIADETQAEQDAFEKAFEEQAHAFALATASEQDAFEQSLEAFAASIAS